MIFNSESRCISYISYNLVSKKCIACRKDINTTHMYCTHLWTSKILLLGSVRIHLLTRFPRLPWYPLQTNTHNLRLANAN